MWGKIIVIEGTECSGKDTQTQLLVQRLKREGRKVEKLSFPMYDTPTGKIIGGPYLGKEFIGNSYFAEGAINVDPKVAALYYAADRRYNLRLINQLLEDGTDLILDRYVESNMAHQGCKILDREERLKLYQWFETLEYDLLELPKPDLTILLHMPYKKVLELKNGRLDREKEGQLTYLKTSEEAYLELADLKKHQVIKCVDKDKLRDVLTIHEEIYNIVIKEILKK
jgi:dTMP kinase